MDKSVLIVTPFFAPQSHAAVFRAYKLAKYLPRFGWKPYVVTTDTNYNYNEDPSLLEALPSEVEIIRARHIEPTLRGLRMALCGKDRTFKALKAAGRLAQTAAQAREDAFRPGLLRRAYQYLRERFLYCPDGYWTWRGPALRAARSIIRQHGVKLVFTSADPYTCHLIGHALQREGCKWVADLRDPHAYNHHTSSRYAAVYARQREAERLAATRADAVTVASSAIAMILTDMYGLKDGSRLHFIPTGLDEELLPPQGSTPPRNDRYIVFSGEYLPEYGDAFLEVFAAASARPDAASLGVKFLIIGRKEVNEPRVSPHVKRLGIEKHVEFIDHMPQQELYKLLAGAMAGVLLTGRFYRWWCLYAKLVDYLALRKPVLAMVPDPSEARTRLTQAGLGIFLDGDRKTAALKLGDFLVGKMDLPLADNVECTKYTANWQVRSFVELFDDLLVGKGGNGGK